MAKRSSSILSKGSEKRGGYSGSKPAAQMRPPARIPSGFVRPNGQKPSNGKGSQGN